MVTIAVWVGMRPGQSNGQRYGDGAVSDGRCFLSTALTSLSLVSHTLWAAVIEVREVRERECESTDNNNNPDSEVLQN
jgi:hypothetical protein